MDMNYDMYGKESAKENLRDGGGSHDDDLRHHSDSISAVSAKKESKPATHAEYVVNDPFDLQSKRISAKESEDQRNSSCRSYGSDEDVSISDVESEASLKS
jgi:hypothetical protein